MRIDLLSGLRSLPLRGVDIDKFIISYSDIEYDYNNVVRRHSKTIRNSTLMWNEYAVKKQTLFPVHNTLPGEAQCLHKNFLEYLEQCWANHYGALITPDIIWYSLLCEIALLVAENPSQYRELFSTSPDQVEISVFDEGNATILPLESIIKELCSRVPDEFTNVFMDDFSTTSLRSRSARSAAFADVVSPYYSYTIYCCGIPFVEVAGTESDWKEMRQRWINLSQKLSKNPEDDKYFSKINFIITNIMYSFTKDVGNFWNDMFRAELCGSGSEIELYGWATKLFRKQPDEVRKACNFSTHVSNVNYKHLQTKKNFTMKQGLFYSVVDNNLLVPDFGMMVYEKEG